MNSKVERWLTIATLVGWSASIGSMVILGGRVTAPNVAIPRLTPPATAGTVQTSDQLQKSGTQMGASEPVLPSPTTSHLSSNVTEPK